ncbi:MAG: hypothetical protein GEU26_07605 [Nitrososphaeraceae archaeon]|nr:hypothetical protein [Nitrososphaeraceae archaeon]
MLSISTAHPFPETPSEANSIALTSACIPNIRYPPPTTCSPVSQFAVASPKLLGGTTTVELGLSRTNGTIVLGAIFCFVTASSASSSVPICFVL